MTQVLFLLNGLMQNEIRLHDYIWIVFRLL